MNTIKRATLVGAAALTLGLGACSSEGTGLTADAGDDAPGGDSGAKDTAPDLAIDTAPEVAPDLPPEARPAPCKPSSPERAAVCGVIYRSATLPLLPGEPRADAKGPLVVFPFSCDPFAPGDDGCAGKEPQMVGSAVSFMVADLSAPDAELKYEIVDLMPGRVHVLAILLEVAHPLDEGLKGGDTLVTPVPRITLEAGQAIERDLKLSAMARDVNVKVAADAMLKPVADGKGPLLVLAYEMAPMMGSQPIAAGSLPDTGLPATVSLTVLQPKTYYLTSILDDDNSSMDFMNNDMLLTSGDLLRTAPVTVTIDPDKVEAQATLTLDELWP